MLGVYQPEMTPAKELTEKCFRLVFKVYPLLYL